ncbi:hypothetical protein ACJMK2_000621, partial [Sinanodonta woodiana]
PKADISPAKYVGKYIVVGALLLKTPQKSNRSRGKKGKIPEDKKKISDSRNMRRRNKGGRHHLNKTEKWQEILSPNKTKFENTQRGAIHNKQYELRVSTREGKYGRQRRKGNQQQTLYKGSKMCNV